MCIGSGSSGGGGDGGAQAAADESARREAERQAEIDRALSRVNATYAPQVRNPIYDDIYRTTYNRNIADLQEQYGDAQREHKFDLVRRGQSGGSAGADRYSDLRGNFNKGVQRVSSMAQDAKSYARNADEQQRSSLVNSIYGGMDSTTAADRAGSQSQVAVANANANANNMTLGDWFARVAQQVQQQRAASAQAAGVQQAQDEISSYYPSGGNYHGQIS